MFARAHRQGFGPMSMAHGTGFAMARHTSEQGELYWSAPTFLHVVGHGVGLSLGEDPQSTVCLTEQWILGSWILSSDCLQHKTSAGSAGSTAQPRLCLDMCIKSLLLLPQARRSCSSCWCCGTTTTC